MYTVEAMAQRRHRMSRGASGGLPQSPVSSGFFRASGNSCSPPSSHSSSSCSSAANSSLSHRLSSSRSPRAPGSSRESLSAASSSWVRPPPGLPLFPTDGGGSVVPSNSVIAASSSYTPSYSAFPSSRSSMGDSSAAVHAAGSHGDVSSGSRQASVLPRSRHCRPEGASPAIFLPGDPLLPLVRPETGDDSQRYETKTTVAAVHRLAELVQEYDAESAAVAAAAEAAAAAAETHAASSRSSPSAVAIAGGLCSTAHHHRTPASHVACIFAEQFPLFPYPPAYISCCMQRYEPNEGDTVLGLVNGKTAGEYFTVSLRGRMDALLHQIAGFEGATKQNHPRLHNGCVVLCRVERAAAAAAALLTCIDSNCKKTWHSAEKFYGELHGGCLLDVPPPLATSLMAPHCFVLEALGQKLKFELAAACNGRIWVKAHEAEDIVLIANVLLASYGKEPHVIQAIVNALMSRRHDRRKR